MSDVDPRPDSLNLLSICTGGGGLDVGVELAIPSARAVLYVEREAYACGRLVAAMEEGRLASAPIWTDATAFAGRSWRGLVDGLIGGIPCFAPGTMVLSWAGYRPIEQLRVGDLVLTHRGRWRPITSVMARDGAEYREVRAQGCAGIVTTDEHPFFAVDRRGAGSDDARWVDARDLSRHHRLSQILPPVHGCPHSLELLWLLGRFVPASTNSGLAEMGSSHWWAAMRSALSQLASPPAAPPAQLSLFS